MRYNLNTLEIQNDFRLLLDLLNDDGIRYPLMIKNITTPVLPNKKS